MLSPSGTKILFSKNIGKIYVSTPLKSNQSMCQKHQLKLQYFCKHCNVGICSDCAILTNNHKGHLICKISQKKLKYKQQVTYMQQSIKIFKDKTTKLQQQEINVIKNSKNINKKAEHFPQLFTKSQLIQYQKNKCSYQPKITSIQKRQQNYKILQNKMSQILKTIQKQPKSKLVTLTQKLSEKLKQILKTTKQQENSLIIPIQNPIVPKYQRKTYILDNYKYLQQKGDILISQPLYYKGTQWRLKIFPGGINHQKTKSLDQFLSIHIQLCQAYAQNNVYRFRIQLVNQVNRTKCLSYQNQRQFSPGQQFCLDNFIKISTLFQQNFINYADGYIQIVLHIRCVSYYHITKYQQQVIKLKQAMILQNNNKLKILYKQANDTGILTKNNTINCKVTENREIRVGNSNRAIDQLQ